MLTLGGLASFGITYFGAESASPGIMAAGVTAYFGLWLYDWITAILDCEEQNQRVRMKIILEYGAARIPDEPADHPAGLAYEYRF